MSEAEPSHGETGLPPALRALGWGVLTGAPILIAALATVLSRPAASPRLLMQSAWAALLAGALAAAAVLLSSRGATAAARRVGALAVLVVVLFSGFLVWLSAQLQS